MTPLKHTLLTLCAGLILPLAISSTSAAQIPASETKTDSPLASVYACKTMPKLGLPSLGDSEKDDVLEFPVKSVSKTRAGIVITMENGQVWKGVNGRLNYIPKGDLTARISRGAVGSYRLSITNGKERVRGLGVRRVE